MTTKRGHDFDDVPVSSNEKLPQVKELVSLMEFTDKFITLRLVGKLYAYGTHWVNTKRRDGSRTSFPTSCLAFDQETGQRDSTKECPWCEHERKHPQPKDAGERAKYFGSSFATDYYINALSRPLQKRIGTTVDAPTKVEAKTGFKSKESDTQTPFVVVRLTPSLVRSIKGLKELNVHEDENGDSTAYAITHPKFGRDISIKYDKDAAGAAKYPTQLGGDAPMKAVEKKFLQWELTDLVPSRSYADELTEYTRWADKFGFSAKKKSSKDIDEEDSDSGLDDDDEDEKPVKKSTSKTKPSPAKKPKYEEEDEEEDEEDAEDEKPVKKSSGKKPAPWSEPEEDEEEDSDEEQEEEEKPKRKPVAKSKPAARKPAKDDDDDDDDAEEDEDEKPARKPAPKKPAAKSTKKPKYEEEDEEDEY